MSVKRQGQDRPTTEFERMLATGTLDGMRTLDGPHRARNRLLHQTKAERRRYVRGNLGRARRFARENPPTWGPPRAAWNR